MAKKELKKIELVYREALKLVENLKELDLTKETKKSRVTFSNPRRVVALEPRKHYILVHSPELKFLEKSTLLSEDKTKFQKFNLTRDSRDFTYIRIYSLTELEDLKTVVTEFASHNRP